MKQFNLEEYLNNSSRKVMTRDERSLRIRCTDRKSEEQPIVAVGSSIWPTEEAAKTAADADDIVTIKIKWEE